MNDKISIIVPVYNVESYINRCIDSIVNQTYKNLEIICVDDGSTDKSGEICDLRALKDDRIKVIHKKNKGLGSSRNEGMKIANGEYILFLDSDDYIEENTIEKLLDKAILGYDIVCCGFDRVDDETGSVYSKEMISMDFDELEINKVTIMDAAFLTPSAWGKLFKRELLDGIRFSENILAIEDTLFYLEIMPRINKMYFIKEILWHYMVKEGSLIMSLTKEKADLFEQDLIKVKNKYIENNYSKEYFDFLTLEVFIHDAISIPSRLYNNKDIKISKRLKHIKNYLNTNFKDWKSLKINTNGNFIKKLAIYIVRVMYRLNIFIVFLFVYNFMINKLKLDVKW